MQIANNTAKTYWLHCILDGWLVDSWCWPGPVDAVSFFISFSTICCCCVRVARLLLLSFIFFFSHRSQRGNIHIELPARMSISVEASKPSEPQMESGSVNGWWWSQCYIHIYILVVLVVVGWPGLTRETPIEYVNHILIFASLVSSFRLICRVCVGFVSFLHELIWWSSGG